MKPILKFTSLIANFLFSCCQSVWKQPIPHHEIIYQGEEIFIKGGKINISSGYLVYTLGFVDSNGQNNQILKIKKQFARPVWSENGMYLYGLSDGSASSYGYPAYWDLQRGRYKVCNRKLPYYDLIQGSGNPENIYEVIIQNIWTISVMDLSNCKMIRTLVDYSSRPGEYAIAGFSYSTSRQELKYGLILNPDGDREYRLMHLDLKTGEKVQIAEGINPSWSPDGTQIAYIGLDGLFTMAVDDDIYQSD